MWHQEQKPLPADKLTEEARYQMGDKESELTCEVCLVLEPTRNAARLSRLERLLKLPAVTCLIVKPPSDQEINMQSANAVISLCQGSDVAALVCGRVDIAQTTMADGVHLTWAKDFKKKYRDAREFLGNEAIIGADAGKSRHAAMVLAEEGANYVAFGAPPHVTDTISAQVRRRELIAWWAEIFEVPCVAFDVCHISEVSELAAVGANFVALALPHDMADDAFSQWTQELDLAVFQPQANALREGQQTQVRR